MMMTTQNPYHILVNCKQCSKQFYKQLCEIKNTKSNFCSRSCSATFNNKGVQRNKPIVRTCKNCGEEYTCSTSHSSKNSHRSTMFCRKCVPDTSDRTFYYKTLTLGEYQNKESVKDKHPSWKSAHIRQFNRSWNSNLLSLPCQVCNYSTHIELAHIKAVSDFDSSATIGEINDPSNILVLCRNHHWEFDHGHLKLKDIPKR